MEHNTTIDLERMAFNVASVAHEGQFRRDEVTPYIEHPRAVAKRVKTPEQKAVAWLHDVLEDTPATRETLVEQGFPADVIEAVEAMTHRTGEPYQDYLERVRANSLARKVKTADMLANLADTPTRRQIIRYAKGLIFLNE